MRGLPGYDAWKLSGDGHYRELEFVCPNPDCIAFGELQVERIWFEYGFGELPECLHCGTYMEDPDDFNTAFPPHELEEARELEVA